MLRTALGLGAGLALAATTIALAGPPYLTDDPEPTDTGHWEIYNYVIAANGSGGFGGEGGFDINYGGAKDLQLTAVIPFGFDNPRGLAVKGLTAGAGVVELAAKYRFVHQDDKGWLPDVSLFPRLFTPTDRRFGTNENLLLPVWAEKDFGKWSVFGGGGYQINPGSGQRDFWQGGLTVARQLDERLQLGVEWFGQGASDAQGGGYQALDLGLTYKLVEHWSLLASGGPSWEQGGSRGQVFYLALKADY